MLAEVPPVLFPCSIAEAAEAAEAAGGSMWQVHEVPARLCGIVLVIAYFLACDHEGKAWKAALSTTPSPGVRLRLGLQEAQPPSISIDCIRDCSVGLAPSVLTDCIRCSALDLRPFCGLQSRAEVQPVLAPSEAAALALLR